MEPQSRVFVIAETSDEASRLADVFLQSAAFIVEGFTATLDAEQLKFSNVDVIVIRAEHWRAFPIHTDVPVLWLRSSMPDGRTPGQKLAILSGNGTPNQIRAATLALAAGLHFGSSEKTTDHSDEMELTLTEPLTDRELEVLNLLAEGLSNPQIAKRLRVSRNTVKFHVSSIIAKLAANSRTEAVTLGLRRGLIII